MSSMRETGELVSTDIELLLTDYWRAKGVANARIEATGMIGTGAQARDGRHMGSTAKFVRQMFIDAGLAEHEVTLNTVVPGYYRRSKNWDVVAVHKGNLVGLVELKSQNDSPGENANNRIEEAIGNAHDAIAVQDVTEAFGSLGVWAAWAMIFHRDVDRVSSRERTAKFPLDPAFYPFSYAKQYGIMIQRLIAHNVYQAGWMLETWVNDDDTIGFEEPVPTATAETLRTQIEARVKFALQALADEPSSSGFIY